MDIWILKTKKVEMHVQSSKMRPVLVNRRGTILFHDIARAHVATMTLQKLTNLGYETSQHSSYSPDFSPTDNHFFKHLDIFYAKKFLFKVETVFKDFQAYI